MEFREVTIQWNGDAPEDLYDVIVAIGGEWTEGEDDDNVFFYFENEDEFEFAKTYHEGEDFRIVTESEETE